MKTYQFESVIKENGIIILPNEISKLSNHRVKLILVDLDAFRASPPQVFSEITGQYAALDEEDLDITEIYRQREISHERGIVFD
jgi:hypothetical protein